MAVCTRLKEIRELRGISAADLARRAGVTRQTIYSIEDGSFVPNTAIALHLSRVLDVTVEAIFSIEEKAAPEQVSAHVLSGKKPVFNGTLVRLCRVNQSLIAVPVSSMPAYLPAADAVVDSAAGRTALIRRHGDALEEGRRLLIAGCDPALSVLNELLDSSGVTVVTVPCSSRRALQWLEDGSVHAAGSHLLDHATGDYNVPFVRRRFRAGSVRVVTFASWEQGLVVRRGNPKSIHTVADLVRKDVTIINREKGAGSRDLLDRALRKERIRSENVKGYSSIAHGHLEAAYAVATGGADCCIAPRSASFCFGLGFVPLAVERFDLCFSKQALELPATKAVLNLLNRSALRKKLEAFAGYDTARSGQVLV